MKEFAVWYKKKWEYNYKQKFEFMTLKQLMESGDDDYCDFDYFEFIGLKDINNNKIYADCSIVEFEWVNGFGNIQTDWGVFKYDLDYLQYLIYEENEDINKSSIKEVFNIKIIDTIQENKLGLIKE